MIIKSIMLIDDDMDEHDLFFETLRELSFDIVFFQAFDGDDALEQLRKSATLPDLIFLDINMPMQNGFDILQRLKAMTACRHIPVIMYSTSTADGDKKRSIALGAREYAVKPISPAELSRLLSAYVSPARKDGK